MASASTLTRMRTLAPEFASTSDYPDATLSIWLDDIAARAVGRTPFGLDYTNALCLYAAHALTMALRSASGPGSGSVGAVTSVSAGPQSISYGLAVGATSSDTIAWLRQTTHGLAYLAIWFRRPAAMPTVV